MAMPFKPSFFGGLSCLIAFFQILVSGSQISFLNFAIRVFANYVYTEAKKVPALRFAIGCVIFILVQLIPSTILLQHGIVLSRALFERKSRHCVFWLAWALIDLVLVVRQKMLMGQSNIELLFIIDAFNMFVVYNLYQELKREEKEAKVSAAKKQKKRKNKK